MNHWASARRCVGLRLFSEGFAQHVFVQREIGHQAFQPPILVLQLPHTAEFAHPQMREFLLPLVERRLADPQLPADVGGRAAALRLPQRVGDLFLRKLRALHRSLPFLVGDRQRQLTLLLTCCTFPGTRQIDGDPRREQCGCHISFPCQSVPPCMKNRHHFPTEGRRLRPLQALDAPEVLEVPIGKVKHPWITGRYSQRIMAADDRGTIAVMPGPVPADASNTIVGHNDA